MKKRKKRWENKTIEIGGLLYNIKYTNFNREKRNNIALKALISLTERNIYLYNNLSPSEEIQSLMHEIIHGVLDALLPPEIMAKMDDISELLIEPFSRLLISALRSADLLKE